MKKILVVLVCAACSQKFENTIELPSPPRAPGGSVTEYHFGKAVTDPYRNLENLDDPEVRKWFGQEADYANAILSNINGRDELIRKMRDFDNRKPCTVTQIRIKEGDQYFYLKQNRGEDRSVLYYRKDFQAEEELLYDPKSYKPESQNPYQINYIHPSWDGSYVVIALTNSGHFNSEMIIMNMENRKILPQVITHCDPYLISWLPDNRHFIYSRIPENDPTSYQFLHNSESVLYKVGDDPKKFKVLLSSTTHPELELKKAGAPTTYLISKNDKFLYNFFQVANTYLDAYYAEIEDIGKDKMIWKPLHKDEDKAAFYGEGCAFLDGSFIYISARDASNREILKSPVGRINMEESEVIVAEKKDEVIEDFKLTADGLYYSTTRNGVEGKLYFSDFKNEHSIELPKNTGKVTLSSKGPDFRDLWVTTTGWINEQTRYRFDIEKEEFIEEGFSLKGDYPEFKNFVVKEVLVPSHDMEMVPLSIIHQADIKFDNKNPCILFGSGSFGIPESPEFRTGWLTWVEEGGIWAVAHVRGGGEKGESWYEAGKKTTKPNSWKDFIACAEYLVRNGYTSNKKMVSYSARSGSIVTGRAMIERPDLFAAVITRSGLLNPLRFEHTPNGPIGAEEFGISTDSVECLALIEMDTYLKLDKNTTYPPNLVMAGMHEGKVSVWQPGKFAARLQSINQPENPVLLYVDYGNSQGYTYTKSSVTHRMASILSFAFWQTGHLSYTMTNGAF